MKGNGLSKLYDQLTIDERIRLRVRALARGDHVDGQRLDRACPYPDYRDYCARLDAADALTLRCLVELLPKLAKLRMVDAIQPVVAYLEACAADAAAMAYLDGLAAGWRRAGKRGRAPEVADAELEAAITRAYTLGGRFSELLDRVAATIARSARTSRDGLAAFAEAELGLAMADLLGAYATPVLGVLAEHQAALDAAESDAEGTELLRDVLRVAWRRHGLGDASAEPDDELRAQVEAVEQRAEEAAECAAVTDPKEGGEGSGKWVSFKCDA